MLYLCATELHATSMERDPCRKFPANCSVEYQNMFSLLLITYWMHVQINREQHYREQYLLEVS